MSKVIKGMIILFSVFTLSSCSISPNNESFRIFDNSQGIIVSKEIKNVDEFNSLKELLKDANWSNKLLPVSEPNYTIKHEKEGQTELVNNYKVWLKENNAIISDSYNHKYGTLDGVSANKIEGLLKIVNH